MGSWGREGPNTTGGQIGSANAVLSLWYASAVAFSWSPVTGHAGGLNEANEHA